MKKRILALVLAMMMVVTLMPCMSFAAADNFQKTFFPGGSISKPQHAPYMLHEADGTYGDTIKTFYYIPDDLKKLGEAYEKSTDFDEEYGVYGRYTLRIQMDGKLDDGPWQYDRLWDTDDWGGSDEKMPDYMVSGYEWHIGCGETNDIISKTQTDLYYINSDMFAEYAGWLAGGITKATNENGNAVYHLDMKNHTFSYRYRYLVMYKNSAGDDYRFILSPWSDTVSIGKNGNQVTPKQLTNLPAPTLSKFELVASEDNTYQARYFMTVPEDYSAGQVYYSMHGQGFEPYSVAAEIKVGDGSWQSVYTSNQADLSSGFRTTGGANTAINKTSQVQVRVRILDNNTGKYSPYSNVVGTTAEYIASTWALPYIAEADEMGLIPDCLVGVDLKQKITRKEFAALAVKVYENMSGNTKAVPGEAFADCTDKEVLKAVAIGITNGTDTKKNLFSPNANITREQCATMLARAYKATEFSGWTLATDASFNAQFKALFTMPAKFADDKKISSYAKDSVYFMVANDIINGVGNNMFAPVADATKGAAYGMATREQALKIAVGMVGNL